MPVTHIPVSGRQINAADWHEGHEYEFTPEEIIQWLGYTPADEGELAPIPDGIVTGCEVAYIGDLDFIVSAGSFYLDGVLIEVDAQTISLDAADPTFDRIDALYLDADGIFGKLTGEAADTPSLPIVEADQFFLTFATVPAAATDLGDQYVTEVIYDEGTDWVETASHGTIVIDSTNNPNSGTKCIEVTAVTANQYVKFVRTPSLLFDGTGHLRLDIRAKAAWANARNLLLRFYLGGVAKGVGVVINNGAFGFVTTNITTYQPILIDKALFGMAAGQYVDELRITARGTGGTMGFYMDPIKLITDIETIDEVDHDHLLIPDEVAGTSYTIQLTDRVVAKRLTNAAEVTIIVPTNATVPVPIGARVRFGAEGAAGAVVAEAVGVTIICREDLRNAAQGSVFELHKVAINTWYLLGDVQ